MRSKFKWIFTLLVAFTMQFSFAQQKTVTGNVSDEFGGLPGATVVVKGTSNGVTTDFDGNYSIAAKAGDVLEFSFTGKKKSTVTVGVANVYNVELQGALVGDEIVVVGYGTTTKEAYTGSAAVVKQENVEAKTFSNVSQALKGEVAGVNVVQTSGQPGSDALIRIRGFGSVNGNRNPLYVVDGVPLNTNVSGLNEINLSAINPADIESMTILKDAAATSVYGSRGANGVVLITTKKGKKGDSKISVDFRTSINSLALPTYDVIESPEEYIELSWEAVKNRAALQGQANPSDYANNNLYGGTGIDPFYNIWNVNGNQLINPATGKLNAGVSRKYTPEKWSDFAFRTGYRQEANVQFSGGTDKTTYATTFGFVDDEGYGINSDFRRYTARLALNHKPKDWLDVGGTLSYAGSRTTQNGQSSDTGSIFLMANNSPRIYSIFLRDENGNIISDPIYGGNQFDYGNAQYTNGNGFSNERRFSTTTNGIGDATLDLTRNFTTTVIGNFNLNLQLAKNLRLENSYGAQFENSDLNDRSNPHYGSASGVFGRLTKGNGEAFNQNFLQLLRYNKTFNDHGLEVFFAHEAAKQSYKYLVATKQNAILFNTLDLDQYTTAFGKASSYSRNVTLDSYFSQLNYNYNSKYFLTASVRRDGSSRFINNKWGTFWSVGAGWIMSKEDFMSNLTFVDYLKLKASYGVIGDQGTRVRYGWQIYSIDTTDNYSFTISNEQGNPDLTWETSNIAQVGLETTLFNGLFDVNVEYYVKNTNNLFFTQNLPGSSGFQTTFLNSGQMRNSGLEFDIAANIFKPKKQGDFKLSLGVNGELLNNEITEMPIDILTNERKPIDGNLSKGKSIFDFYMREWAGVDPANGQGLWNMYYDDVNGNGVFDSGDSQIGNMVNYLDQNTNANVQKTTTYKYGDATETYVGKSSIPKVRGAFRLNANYKNFDFSTQFSYSIGGYSYDNQYAWLMDNENIGANNWHVDIRNRWQNPGDVTDVPRISDAFADSFNDDTAVRNTSTRFLVKADYLSLNNLRIGYTLPAEYLKRMNVRNLNLYVSGDNLMFFSHRDGFNPSTAETGSSNIYRYTPLSTYSLGVKVEF